MRVKEFVRIGVVLLASCVAAIFAHAQGHLVSPGAAPHFHPTACQAVYLDASHAVDGVYGLLPDVGRAEMLRDSMIFDDAARFAANPDPKVSGTFCTFEQMTRLRRLTAELRAARDRYDPDSSAYRIRQMSARTVEASREASGWVSTK